MTFGADADDIMCARVCNQEQIRVQKIVCAMHEEGIWWIDRLAAVGCGCSMIFPAINLDS